MESSSGGFSSNDSLRVLLWVDHRLVRKNEIEWVSLGHDYRLQGSFFVASLVPFLLTFFCQPKNKKSAFRLRGL